MIRSFFSDLTSAFFPLRCVGCQRLDVILCEECAAAFPLDPRMIPGSSPQTLRLAAYDQPLVRSLIRALKFESQPQILDPLTPVLSQIHLPEEWNDAVLCPIPLSSQRLRERGYNQSLLLAKALGYSLGLPVVELLQKRAHTRPQAQISHQLDRLHHLPQELYQCDTALSPVEKILLIDDISTTGATLSRAESALRKAGATQVFALVLAHGH